ncbi:tripartite tricarboxylate transporter substrate binding protein [Candidatus Pelagibacter sp.]|jgi:tripartite-type tricarboxylate transporter receptor subunit TctC|nr:tripartite tricarboxylate transporter substrate binding protein [Candidatus Pelagibacter sp.]
MSLKKIFFYLTILLSIVSFGKIASAADFPDRPISVMVAYNPGGATDFQARLVTMMAAHPKTNYLGQPIVIVNKPGAGGKVGWNWFADKARKDGYDLAAYNIPHFVSQSIVFDDTKYNIDNLEPIANWGADPAVLIVSKDSQFNSAADLVKYAKANPGKVTFSGAGKFVGHHIAFLQFEKASGADITYVPHTGGVPALAAVKGGQVMAGFNNLSDAYRSQNDIKILAIADLQREKTFLPNVPTLKEEGIDVDNSSVNFRGIMAPKGTPKEVIDFLAKQVPLMFNDKKTLGQMKKGGSPVRIMNRSEVQEMWKAREKSLTTLLAGLKPE